MERIKLMAEWDNKQNIKLEKYKEIESKDIKDIIIKEKKNTKCS